MSTLLHLLQDLPPIRLRGAVSIRQAPGEATAEVQGGRIGRHGVQAVELLNVRSRHGLQAWRRAARMGQVTYRALVVARRSLNIELGNIDRPMDGWFESVGTYNSMERPLLRLYTI